MALTVDPNKDVRIRRLATTSDWQTLGDENNWQFMVWIVADPRVLSIFAAPAPPQNFAESVSRYNPYLSTRSAWTIGFNGADTYFIEEIAVAQWLSPQTPATLFSSDPKIERISLPADVGAVVRFYANGIGGGTLRLYINALRVDLDASPGSPIWSTGLTTTSLSGLPPNATTVALGHAYVGNAKISTFFLAYNYFSGAVARGCGIVSVTSDQIVTYLDLPVLASRSLISAAFMPVSTNNNAVYFYMVFTQQPQIVRMIRWIGGSINGEMMDELFFAESAILRSLLISGSNTFAALVETPVLDAASGQAILHPDGPPLEIKVADNVQRTFTGLQGMPIGSHPTTMAAPLPMGNGKLMWISANGPDIFSIMSSRCLPDPSAPNVPRYWDGGQCLAHVCVRSRPCTGTGQIWDASLMQCVCKNGYYYSTTASVLLPLVCYSCTTGYYCANGTRTVCPNGMTTNVGGAVFVSECTCKDSQYFVNGRCETCRAGQWCPNRRDSVACLGNFDAARSSKLAEMYPKSCVCAPGYTGVACMACPVGYFCPSSSSTAVNWVAMARIVAPTTTDLVCSVLLPIFINYLSSSKINYILDDRRILCKQYLPDRVLLMIQTETVDVNNNILNALPSFLKFNATQAYTRQMGNFVLDGILPTTDQASKDVAVPVNVPVACPAGKSPSHDRTACMCSAGFEGTECVACTANRYKADAGGGVCLACPIGFYSGVGSSACVGGSSSSKSSDSSDGSNNNNNTPIIVGASVGGGVAVLLIGWGIFAASTANSASSVAYSPLTVSTAV